MSQLRAYELIIKTEAGCYRCAGLFQNDWAAIDAGLGMLPGVMHVIPRRVRA